MEKKQLFVTKGMLRRKDFKNGAKLPSQKVTQLRCTEYSENWVTFTAPVRS